MSDDPAQALARLRAQAAPPLFLFWAPEPGPGGGLGPGCLSQWWPAPFVVDGTVYPTAEHWMMAGKARLFDDAEVLREILDAPGPEQAKDACRRVRRFDSAVWAQQRYDVVVAGNRAKISHDDDLRVYLASTAPATLVEASPRDAIWGVGLAADDPSVPDPTQWPGLNLLGFALAQVRTELG